MNHQRGDPEEGWCVVQPYHDVTHKKNTVVAGPFISKQDAGTWEHKQDAEGLLIKWGKKASDGSGEYVATRAVSPAALINRTERSTPLTTKKV